MSEQSNFNLNKDKTNQMLENILESCNIPPSSESLDSIMLKRSIEKKPLIALKIIAAIFLVVSVITPLAFRKDPNFSLLTNSRNVAVNTHNLYEDCFIMTLSGSADYSNIYAKKDDGAIIFPDEVDSASGLVIFPYNGEALNISIPTTSGECVQAILHETDKK